MMNNMYVDSVVFSMICPTLWELMPSKHVNMPSKPYSKYKHKHSCYVDFSK